MKVRLGERQPHHLGQLRDGVGVRQRAQPLGQVGVEETADDGSPQDAAPTQHDHEHQR